MAKTYWLRCDSVERGMFTDELTVVVQRKGGEKESFFVPQEMVELERRALSVDAREMDNFFWVTLPTAEKTTIAVNRNQVEVK